MSKLKPLYKVDMDIDGDDIHTFAKKYNAEVDNIYNFLNETYPTMTFTLTYSDGTTETINVLGDKNG
jgi:hypothetical protein